MRTARKLMIPGAEGEVDVRAVMIWFVAEVLLAVSR
jgi:hypothetical protein